jgi:hypothetical protein
VDSVGLEAYVVDAARATRELLRASPRATKNFMLGMILEDRSLGKFRGELKLRCGTEEPSRIRRECGHSAAFYKVDKDAEAQLNRSRAV